MIYLMDKVTKKSQITGPFSKKSAKASPYMDAFALSKRVRWNLLHHQHRHRQQPIEEKGGNDAEHFDLRHLLVHPCHGLVHLCLYCLFNRFT